MPLNTRIKRDGKPLSLPNGWGSFHVTAMILAAAADSGQGPYEDMPAFIEEAKGLMKSQGRIGVAPHDTWNLMNYYMIATTPLNHGGYVLKERWEFIDKQDGEVLELLPGDELIAWRD